MKTQERFNRTDDLMLKVRTIATRCSDITADMPRTLLLGVTAPDPETTPNCRHADPRGFWINRLDTRITAKAVAEMLGAMQGVIDMLENDYAGEFGEEFHEQFDEVRSRMHGLRANMLATEPLEARSWPQQ